ncbi:hypothetical protein Psuf_048890 [Phytohabitans suffuscus]|uniref:Uncharacterized protein n=1 Tax=Phytohabitans suffuscus TaxID=624315 RepID=A0A6F8YNG4_9ACTN|nr:hypothetical protein Psuf_048890 [Phytohabitans suffuscus]
MAYQVTGTAEMFVTVTATTYPLAHWACTVTRTSQYCTGGMTAGGTAAAGLAGAGAATATAASSPIRAARSLLKWRIRSPIHRCV